MTLKDYLIFFRWKNILMIILIQYLFKYILFEKFNIQVSLDHLHFALLTLSTAFVAIAGYIINDMYDVKADIINKPEKLFVDKKITRMMAQNLFIGFNSVGLVLGMYLSYHIGHTSYFMIYLLTSLLLYQYAKHLKKKFLLGNIMVSSVVLFCILMLAVFDVAPATNNYNLESQKGILHMFLMFGTFGFALTFLREIVKDMEDIEGDKAIEAKSFPILYGEEKTKKMLMIGSIAVVLGLNIVIYLAYKLNKPVSYYLSGAVILPLLYFITMLYKASNKKDYHKLSGLLKLIMLLGILSMLLI